jgi:hypothetical protein
MKTHNKLAIVALTAVTTLFVNQARAQYRPAGDDGIAASPKVRAMLNERPRAPITGPTAEIVLKPARATYDIAASPKVRQMLNETESRTTVPAAPAVAVNHTRPADDGITASPKVRAQLNERSNNAIQIAPLK